MLKPNVDHYTNLPGHLSRAFESGNLGALTTELKPGQGIRPHYQNAPMEEYFFVHEGRTDFRLGDEIHAVEPGDVLYSPPEAPPSCVNNYSEPVVYWAVFSPAKLRYADNFEYVEPLEANEIVETDYGTARAYRVGSSTVLTKPSN